MTKKSMEQGKDDLRFKLKQAEAVLIQSLVHEGKEERKSPGPQVTEISREGVNQVLDELQVRWRRQRLA